MQILIPTIIASTSSPSLQLDSRRTDIVSSEDAVKHINLQINLARENSRPIPVYERSPRGKGDKPDIIGEIIKSELRNDGPCLQCVSEIFIYDERTQNGIIKRKKEYCFIPWIGYNKDVSLKKVFEADGHEINCLYPPLKIIAANLADKRSSSNPYLVIL